MNDLISRQAVIDLLKQMRKDGDMVPWEGKDVFARIRKLPSAQPEPKWIPCSARLPFDAGYYLTTTTYNEVFCDYWNLNEWNRTEQVIAWMPLPEPYKGGKHETD